MKPCPSVGNRDRQTDRQTATSAIKKQHFPLLQHSSSSRASFYTCSVKNRDTVCGTGHRIFVYYVTCYCCVSTPWIGLLLLGSARGSCPTGSDHMRALVLCSVRCICAGTQRELERCRWLGGCETGVAGNRAGKPNFRRQVRNSSLSRFFASVTTKELGVFF